MSFPNGYPKEPPSPHLSELLPNGTEVEAVTRLVGHDRK
jgi:hypothetical protein